jgi:hypothetical protein
MESAGSSKTDRVSRHHREKSRGISEPAFDPLSCSVIEPKEVDRRIAIPRQSWSPLFGRRHSRLSVLETVQFM